MTTFAIIDSSISDAWSMLSIVKTYFVTLIHTKTHTHTHTHRTRTLVVKPTPHGAP